MRFYPILGSFLQEIVLKPFAAGDLQVNPNGWFYGKTQADSGKTSGNYASENMQVCDVCVFVMFWLIGIILDLGRKIPFMVIHSWVRSFITVRLWARVFIFILVNNHYPSGLPGRNHSTAGWIAAHLRIISLWFRTTCAASKLHVLSKTWLISDMKATPLEDTIYIYI